MRGVASAGNHMYLVTWRIKLLKKIWRGGGFSNIGGLTAPSRSGGRLAY